VSDAIVPTAEVIERLLGMLRGRLEEAFRNGHNVTAHARAGTKQQVWQPGVNIVPQEDGSFSFSLEIKPKR
jgi:hypothetical protein